MEVPASVADVVSRWRSLDATETAVATTLLGDAWSILQHRLPTLAGRLAEVPPTVDENAVKMVLANMVIRVLRNVDGKTQESIEDYSFTINQLVSAGYLFVSDDELDLLTPLGWLGDAFTIRPHYESDAWPVLEDWT